MNQYRTDNTLTQPMTGFTHVVTAKPATKAELIALRDLMLELGNKDAAAAVDNVVDIISLRAQHLTPNLENGPFPHQQGQPFTMEEKRVESTPKVHVSQEWAKRHLNVESNGFEAELNNSFGKGNWTLDEARIADEARNG